MSAWGKGGTAKSCDALLQRVEANDPTLTDLVILPTKTFGSIEVERLAKAIGPDGSNTHLQSLSASGHAVSPLSLTLLGKAISMGASRHRFKHLAIGNGSLGDEGVVALCHGLVLVNSPAASSTATTTTTTTAEEDGNIATRIPLETLDLSRKGIGSEGMEALVQTFHGGTDRLRTLILSQNEAIGSSDLFQLRTSVEVATSSNNEEQQQSPPPPQPQPPPPAPILPNVVNLDLSECNLNEEASTGLVAKLGPLTSHRNLILRMKSNPGMGPPGMASLSTLLHQSSMVELHLSNCSLGDEGLEHFLKRATKVHAVGLKVLDLSHNGISPVGLQRMATGLQSETICFPQWRELNLSGNTFNESSVKSFAEALAAIHNKKRRGDNGTVSSITTTTTTTPTTTRTDELAFPSALQWLDMSATSTGVGGAVSLVQLAQLTNVNLFNNQLGSEGFLELAKVVQGGHATLEVLDVGGNHANQASVVSLLHALTMPKIAISSSTTTTTTEENEDNTTRNNNALRVLIVGGNEGGSAVEQMVDTVKGVWPNLDIARDKPRKLNE